MLLFFFFADLFYLTSYSVPLLLSELTFLNAMVFAAYLFYFTAFFPQRWPSFFVARPPRYPARQASLARPAAPRTAMLCWATQSCGNRVRPRTHHVPHESCGPWKHLLARNGFLELVPVVVHFPQLVWLLAFSVTFAPLRAKMKCSLKVSFSAMFACSP